MGAADWVALPYHSTFTNQSGVLNVAAHYQRPVLSGAAPVLRGSVDGHPIGVASQGDTKANLAEALALLEQRLTETPPSFSFGEFCRAHSWSENARLTRLTYRRVLGLAEH